MGQWVIICRPVTDNAFDLFFHQSFSPTLNEAVLAIEKGIFFYPPIFMIPGVADHEITRFYLGCGILEILRRHTMPLLHVSKINDEPGSITVLQRDLVHSSAPINTVDWGIQVGAVVQTPVVYGCPLAGAPGIPYPVKHHPFKYNVLSFGSSMYSFSFSQK
jgi:hypothetical protein